MFLRNILGEFPKINLRKIILPLNLQPMLNPERLEPKVTQPPEGRTSIYVSEDDQTGTPNLKRDHEFCS